MFGAIPAMILVSTLFMTLFAEYNALVNIETGIIKPARGVALDASFLICILIMYFLRTNTAKVVPMGPPLRY